MFGNKVFCVTLLVSITAHTALFTPWVNFDGIFKTFKPLEDNPIEVNYLEVKITPTPKIEEKIVAQVSTKNKMLENITEHKKEFQVKDEKTISTTEKETVKLESQKSTIELGSRQQTIAYMSYYNLVRKQIKDTLLKMYKPRFDEGEIYLAFSLQPNGALEQANILDERSTQSKDLKNITLKALKKTSPFPPFPKELDNPLISFNVVISFRK